MRHNELDVKEFQVQLKELCDLNLIRPSKSPHSSPAFMVRNRKALIFVNRLKLDWKPSMLIIHYNFGTAIKFMQTWN